MTRTYAARFTIDDPDDTVALGMTATVTLSRARDSLFAKLPLAAILNRGNGPSVYIVRDSGELELRVPSPFRPSAQRRHLSLQACAMANASSPWAY
jgi:hypothetical protein